MLTEDTWALIAIYLRNLALNLLTISAFFLSVFLVPRLAAWFARSVIDSKGLPSALLFECALVFLTIGLFFISLNQAYWSVK